MWRRVRRFVAFACLGAAGMLALEGGDAAPVFVPAYHAQQWLIGEDAARSAGRPPDPISLPSAAALSGPADPPLLMAKSLSEPGQAATAAVEHALRGQARALDQLVTTLVQRPAASPSPVAATLSMRQPEARRKPAGPRRASPPRWRGQVDLTADSVVGAAPPPRWLGPGKSPAPRHSPIPESPLFQDVVARLYPDPPAMGTGLSAKSTECR